MERPTVGQIQSLQEELQEDRHKTVRRQSLKRSSTLQVYCKQQLTRLLRPLGQLEIVLVPLSK